MLITRCSKSYFLTEFREFNQWTEQIENARKKHLVNSNGKEIKVSQSLASTDIFLSSKKLGVVAKLP